MPRHCEKFHLTQEETHFYSGIDGSLLVPGDDKFFTHDEYCVDYFYDKEEFDPSVDVIKVAKRLREKLEKIEY